MSLCCELFFRIEQLLESEDFSTFHESFLSLYDDFLSHKLDLKNHVSVKQVDDFCQKFTTLSLGHHPKTLHPTKIRRPNHAKTPLAMAKVLHSVAHIEACAILLSLDSAYRFRQMPFSFYHDWLEVADEEIRHFVLLQELLQELDVKYGDFSIHFNLFDALKATQGSLAIRMGVVHRGLEARGLDANPFVVEKLMQTTLAIRSKVKEVFHVILVDEIKHVSKGDKWWKYSTTESFLTLCERFSQFTLAGKTLHIPARLQAGFSIDELHDLKEFYNRAHS